MGCNSSTQKTDTSHIAKYAPGASEVVLRLVSAHHLPALDVFSESDVFAVGSLIEKGKVVGTARWPVKPDSSDPYWDSCRFLGAASEGARVRLEFFDFDAAAPFDFTKISASSPDFIGLVEFGVEDLPAGGEPLNLELRTKHAPRATGLAACVVSRGPPAPAERKTLYLIRHGESVWNEAQAEHDAVRMLSDVDHNLTDAGRKQAEGLAAHLRAEGSGEPSGLLDIDAVVCSPLTRAVQTCLIGLAPLLTGAAGSAPRVKYVGLNPNLREKRNLMGKDSSGKFFGPEIVDGTRASLRALYAHAPELAEPLCGVELGLEAVGTQWWIGFKESEAAVGERVDELISQLQYSPHERIALVGHSHFFRCLLRKLLAPAATLTAPDGQPAEAARLRAAKLSNAGVARCEIEFGPKGAAITSVRLVFADTELVD